MSEQAPERGRGGGGGIKGLFTTKIGPLSLWIWLLIFAGIFIAWRLYEDHQSSSSGGSTSSSSDTGTPDNDVPQFVNQTYVSTTAPQQQPPPQNGNPATPTPTTPKAGTPVKTGSSQEQVTRTWTSLGGSTYAEVAQRLLGNSDVSNLHPANAAAQKWVSSTYAKNKNAKMPKGLEFTYTEGTVTTKT